MDSAREAGLRHIRVHLSKCVTSTARGFFACDSLCIGLLLCFTHCCDFFFCSEEAFRVDS